MSMKANVLAARNMMIAATNCIDNLNEPGEVDFNKECLKQVFKLTDDDMVDLHRALCDSKAELFGDCDSIGLV